MIPAVEKYLARHAEPEIQIIRGLRRSFGHVIVIPAFDETETLYRTLETIPKGLLGDVLTVLVVNARADSPPTVHSRSAQLIQELADRYGSESRRDVASVCRWFQHPRGALLCVDRTGPRSLPDRQGVGLARKIGCDIALRIQVEGAIRSPWIHTTDADVELPSDYFERTESLSGGPPAAACLYPFWHRCKSPPVFVDAVHRYEIFLRYYVLGLADAASPYAFHTLGSTIAVHPVAYAMVRGFPRRVAGEDFYFLNKVAKVGSIIRLGGAPIIIEGRRSHRAPFGTGAALNQMLAATERGERYETYAPEVFLYLKAWLEAVELLSHDLARSDAHAQLIAAANHHDGVDPDLLHRELVHLGFPSVLLHIRAISRDAAGMARHLHTWFDAFRTLKLIHRLTLAFPKKELLEAVRTAPFVPDGARQVDDLEALRRSLMRLENRLCRSGPLQPRTSFLAFSGPVPEPGRMGAGRRAAD